MKSPRMSLTLGFVESRSRSRFNFEFFSHLPQYKLSSAISQLWNKIGSCDKYVCSSDINVQHLGMSSRLNDLMNCKRHFNVDIMNLYISALDRARKLKFSHYVHLPSINKMF